MSRSKNILVVIIAICIVLAAGITHVIVVLGGIGETPAEWKDYFVLNGGKYFNSYNLIDGSFAGSVVGTITSSVPRGADASEYEAKEGEAVYLPVGTSVYSINGFDEARYTAVYDNGEFFLYCRDDCSPNEVISACGTKTLRRKLDFKRVFVNTVCEENSDYGVRIGVIKSRKDLDDYLARYINDFRVSDEVFTYDALFEDKEYGDRFFASHRLFTVRLPEDDGKICYDLDNITSDEEKTTLQLIEYCLPKNVTYDKCTVRHMFVELGIDDYTDQAITYQIERKYLRLEDEVAAPEAGTPPETDEQFVFTFVNSRADVEGSVYESVVFAEYDRAFFDRNALLIVRCEDDRPLEYRYEKVDERPETVLIALSRSEREEGKTAAKDYFIIPFPAGYLDGRLFLPSVRDLGEKEPEERTPGDASPRDVAVIDSLNEFREIAEVYSIDSGIYDEEFFENYVLFFAGYLCDSPDVGIVYSSISKTDNSFELGVKIDVPKTRSFSPAYKYAAIPFLRSAYNGEELTVVVVNEKTVKEEVTLEEFQ